MNATRPLCMLLRPCVRAPSPPSISNSGNRTASIAQAQHSQPTQENVDTPRRLRLSAHRDVAAAKAFLRKAVKGQGRAPKTITLDGYAASHRAVRALKAEGSLPAATKLRSSKCLNNLIEQDHRSVKQRIAAMLGFKRFRCAAITIAGIELMHRIRKQQFKLRGRGLQGGAAPAVWNALLAT